MSCGGEGPEQRIFVAMGGRGHVRGLGGGPRLRLYTSVPTTQLRPFWVMLRGYRTVRAVADEWRTPNGRRQSSAVAMLYERVLQYCLLCPYF